MSGSLEVDTSGLNWSKIQFSSRDVQKAVRIGAQVVLKRSNELVPYAPKETHSGQRPLRTTGKVQARRGGKNTVAITYAGPYARWVHEHLEFKHPHGGQAKFLETALQEKGAEAMRTAALELLK